MNNQGLILLTYKGKVLLMHKQNGVLDPTKHPWSLITVAEDENLPLEETLVNQVYKEMGIVINDVERISETYYHARLTDKNVNNISRSEHQLLDFFSPKETEKLFLTGETQKFIASHSALINPIVLLTP